MTEDNAYIDILNDSIAGYFRDAVLITLKQPRTALFFLRTVWRQKKAAHTRGKWQSNGVHVPALLIISVTNKCNLRCKGCYAYAHEKRRSKGDELDDRRLRSLVAEAQELGVAAILFAGGEPLMRKELLDITRDFPSMIFPIVTNGTLIDERVIAQFKQQKNVLPVVSIEGDERDTDGRRGRGMFGRIRDVMEQMRTNGIFFGCSLTITRSNFETITDPEFIRSLTQSGSKLLLFLEYVSVEEGTEEWVPTEEQRASLRTKMEEFKAHFPALVIAIPGDEEQYGGCLAAGRGFAHISAEGNLEPCPVSPYSDANVLQSSLATALQSKLLREIRRQSGALSETAGGCALWAEREWIRSLVPSKGDIIPLQSLSIPKERSECIGR